MINQLHRVHGKSCLERNVKPVNSINMTLSLAAYFLTNARLQFPAFPVIFLLAKLRALQMVDV